MNQCSRLRDSAPVAICRGSGPLAAEVVCAEAAPRSTLRSIVASISAKSGAGVAGLSGGTAMIASSSRNGSNRTLFYEEAEGRTSDASGWIARNPSGSEA